jgi:hypothetical protein
MKKEIKKEKKILFSKALVRSILECWASSARRSDCANTNAITSFKAGELYSLVRFSTKIFLSLLLTSILVLPFSPTAFANYENPELAAAALDLKQELVNRVGTISISQCSDTLIQLYDLELSEFVGFLDINFKSKQANSALTDIAIERFVIYKQALKGHFSELRPNFVAGDPNATVDNSQDVFQEDFNAQFSPYTDCQKITEAYIDIGKQQFMKMLKDKTAQKKTALFVEKYQNINAEMKNLNMEIAKMFGLFEGFKNKLPGFLSQCVQ